MGGRKNDFLIINGILYLGESLKDGCEKKPIQADGQYGKRSQQISSEPGNSLSPIVVMWVGGNQSGGEGRQGLLFSLHLSHFLSLGSGEKGLISGKGGGKMTSVRIRQILH